MVRVAVFKSPYAHLHDDVLYHPTAKRKAEYFNKSLAGFVHELMTLLSLNR